MSRITCQGAAATATSHHELRSEWDGAGASKQRRTHTSTLVSGPGYHSRVVAHTVDAGGRCTSGGWQTCGQRALNCAAPTEFNEARAPRAFCGVVGIATGEKLDQPAKTVTIPAINAHRADAWWHVRIKSAVFEPLCGAPRWLTEAIRSAGRRHIANGWPARAVPDQIDRALALMRQCSCTFEQAVRTFLEVFQLADGGRHRRAAPPLRRFGGIHGNQ